LYSENSQSDFRTISQNLWTDPDHLNYYQYLPKTVGSKRCIDLSVSDDEANIVHAAAVVAAAVSDDDDDIEVIGVDLWENDDYFYDYLFHE